MRLYWQRQQRMGKCVTLTAGNADGRGGCETPALFPSHRTTNKARTQGSAQELGWITWIMFQDN